MQPEDPVLDSRNSTPALGPAVYAQVSSSSQTGHLYYVKSGFGVPVQGQFLNGLLQATLFAGQSLPQSTCSKLDLLLVLPRQPIDLPLLPAIHGRCIPVANETPCDDLCGSSYWCLSRDHQGEYDCVGQLRTSFLHHY